MELSLDAKLIFRTEKIEGTWHIAGFESIYEKDTIIPVFPDNNINIPAVEISKYRASYGCMIYTMKRRGVSVNENLPGIGWKDCMPKLMNG